MANKKQWNYILAEKILKQFGKKTEIVFESGFGPSGYPHLGTYGEILRPTYVIDALKDLSDIKTKYIVFTDDLDGLRKVPLGMPESLKEHLGKPNSKIPDPWGCCESFSDHNITVIKKWLSEQEIYYDVFKYSHKAYQSGEFNDALSKLLANVEKINSIILPTMREESRKGWSPFMPICEKCGKNLTTRVTSCLPKEDSVEYICDKDSENFKSCGFKSKISVLNGSVKVGWKIDWAVRWYSYNVNFEMYGKDLMEAASLSGKIVRTILGRTPPLGYFYEMFLDEDGSKISKSIGKGLTVESWLSVAPKETLDLFLFKSPQKAKKLSVSMIPRYVDEYLELMKEYYGKDQKIEEEKYKDPYQFVTKKITPKNPYEYNVNFNLLTNLVAAIGKTDINIIKNYILKYEQEKPYSNQYLNMLIDKAVNYVKSVIQPSTQAYIPGDLEKKSLNLLIDYLEYKSHNEEEIQSEIFNIAKNNNIEPKDLFVCIYKLLSGSSSGPRLGSFIHLMGVKEVAKKLKLAIGN